MRRLLKRAATLIVLLIALPVAMLWLVLDHLVDFVKEARVELRYFWRELRRGQLVP